MSDEPPEATELFSKRLMSTNVDSLIGFLISLFLCPVSSFSLPVYSPPEALLQNSSHSLLPQVEDLLQMLQSCFTSTVGIVNFSSFLATCCLTDIPLCALVIFISVQRRLLGSGITASHSDHFTYQTIANIFLSFTGMTLTACGVIAGFSLVMFVGLFIFYSTIFTLMFFDTLTCVERYVAVVHPITYRTLKNGKGVRIRNVAIACAWLLSFSLTMFLTVKSKVLISIIFLSFTALCLVIVFICSLCVLLVLVRPGPGEVGGAKHPVDKSKLRAFYTIVIILMALLIRFGANTFLSSFYTSAVTTADAKCHLILSQMWMTLPGSMVLPLLFVQRAVWFVCGKGKPLVKTWVFSQRDSQKSPSDDNLV